MTEVMLPLPQPIAAARNARSTVLLSSVAAVTAKGLEARYFGALAPQFHETMRGALAGVWLPFDVAIAHYRACDALGLTAEQQADMGRAVEQRIRGTLLGTAVRMAKGAGVTPWLVLPQLQRFWERAFDGGGLTVIKSGPKDARIDVVRFPLNDIAYFRHSLRGVCCGIVDLFCTRAWMQERPGIRPAGGSSFRIQWA